MFTHRQDLQFTSKPQEPDAVYARRLEESLRGQYGEITVAMHYMFHGWDMHVPGGYRDLVFALGAEQVAHVEMLATVVARLLDHAPRQAADAAARANPAVAAVLGGTDLQDAIAAGAGPGLSPHLRNPWLDAYGTVERNLLADFSANRDAERSRLVDLPRVFRLTDDPDVHFLLSYLRARAAVQQQVCRRAVHRLAEHDHPAHRVT
ncbi:manganese catalase family protein [Kribbella sp. NPDC051137]|uniref:manganese catalase family protein n=1 Tax=Kribbella sp. NPDC051137 TaxID=3155045 RepID=UPI003428C999